MRVLIGCEESGVVTKAFRAHGHEAFSCDLEPTRGNPEHHIQGDIVDHLKLVPLCYYDLIIIHPDCTAMAVSGNRWYGENMPRNKDRVASVDWTKKLWDIANLKSIYTCLENPVSVIFSQLKYHSLQYIQPWMFGHGEQKKTGLALKNLPPLVPTDEVTGREQKVWKMPPSPTRKRDRSVTYQGIADAMAAQWGILHVR